MPQKSFVFDLNKCTGCQACQLACKIENQTDPDVNWRRVHTYNELHHPALPVYHLSLACNHCIDPPCLRYCPALAYRKDTATGAVTIDPNKCIGCKYCTWNCPYDAPRFNHDKGIMQKCTFCSHRLEQCLEPACAASCPTGALGFGDYQPNGDGPSIAGFTESVIEPAIRFVPLRALPSTSGNTNEGVPIGSAYTPVDPDDFIEAMPEPESKISARTEWALITFTTVAAFLVAWFTAHLAEPVVWFQPWALIGIGAVAMNLSTIHLGRKLQAYRAIFNWQRSWLSREILFFSGFLGLIAASIILPAAFVSEPITGFLSLGIGFLTLQSIDNVYRVTANQTPNHRIHSAQTVLTAAFLLGMLLSNPMMIACFGVIKLGLYVYRKILYLQEGLPDRPFVSVVRCSLLLLSVLTVLIADTVLPGLFLAFVGELIDRIEFYSELEIITPPLQINQDMMARLYAASEPSHFTPLRDELFRQKV